IMTIGAMMRAQANYAEGIFRNDQLVNMSPPLSVMWEASGDYLKDADLREPKAQIQTIPFSPGHLDEVPDSALAVTWLGHSTMLIRIDGQTILADPIFGPRASMFGFMGPKRFDYSQTHKVSDLPQIDAVVISHDHYDHLDYPTMKQLKDIVPHFYVPLGVGAHLEAWGISPEKITEAVWWDEFAMNDSFKLAFTPTQHFSGRGLTDRNATLWGSWAIMGKNKRVYFSGDSGYFPGFKEIGEKYGPFDLAMMECGAYSKYWADIHMMPEESSMAGQDVRADVVIPIHWGKFNLSIHPWKEPVQRILVQANQSGQIIATPQPGELMLVGKDLPQTKWWEDYD
ncbi:MAG: MBL fold metallo-hydrolase, partial [Bacteroidota bacterium]